MVVSLKHLGSLPLWRQVVVALASGITIVSTAALIALFGILSGFGTLLVGNFYMVSFISFADIVWLISMGEGRSWLLIFCRSA